MRKVDKTSVHINRKSEDFIKQYCLERRGLVFFRNKKQRGQAAYPYVEVWDIRFRRFLGHVVCTWLGRR